MTADQPLAILDRVPMVPAIVGGGILIAIVVGLIGLTVADPVPPMANLFLIGIPALVVSAAARFIWRRNTARATSIITLGVIVKLANMAALLLIGLAALIAFAVGDGHWHGLIRALVLDLMIGFAIAVITATIANVVAFLPSRPPPSAPPA